MKVINPTKYDRVKQYIQEELPVKEIRSKIQSDFGSSISFETIKNLRDKMYCKTIDPTYEIATKQLLEMFMELSQLDNISSVQWNAAIKNHLDFALMDKVKEDLKL